MLKIIPVHGNYKELESYRNCMAIYDGTVDFCARFLRTGDRTIDQMTQAARSGKQNIVEGSMASGISTETEIKLIGVARASLEELLEDYRDFLRTHSLPLWDKNDERVSAIRELSFIKDRSYETYKTYLDREHNSPELFCNLMISLIHQTNYLLDRHLKSLEQQFAEKGGIRERMHRTRNGEKNGQREKVLTLLREIYRDLAELDQPMLQEKVVNVAEILKNKLQALSLIGPIGLICPQIKTQQRKHYEKNRICRIAARSYQFTVQ